MSIITEEFLNRYRTLQPPFGFNGLGALVYARTYSRPLHDGSKEEWYQTVARCINGAQDIGAQYTQSEAERLYDYIFNLKCSFAGRMLWMLGTEHIKRWGGNALLNCYGITIKKPEDFCFLFENLMLGGGVGFSVRREDIHELPKVKENVIITHERTNDAFFIVPDSREGWVNLLRKVLRAFFETGVSFNYSTILVREYGSEIKGLGGTASGPGILVEGIDNICKILQSREGKKLRSIDVLDISNIIASIVVSGNIRRSATIGIGDPDDYLFIRAKRWDLGNIPNWRALSNNTIVADDYDHISNDIWSGFSGNGEPYGLFNIKLSQKVGRLNEPAKDNCELLNPCFSSNTYIKTDKGDFKIKDLVDKEVTVWDGGNWVVINNFRITAYNQKLIKFKIKQDHGIYTSYETIEVTPYHNMCLENGTVILASEIKLEDKLLWWNPFENIINTVIGIEILDNLHTVYCCTVPTTNKITLANGIVIGNCGEATLSSAEVCCLSDIFLNNICSKEELIDCAKLLYKTQKAICSMHFIHEETEKIVHKNFRIGIGVTGICQSLDKLEWLDDSYKVLKEYDREWSKIRNWPESIKLTVTKPSGTLSLLAGSTPGVHPAFSKYYIRRVRMSSDDSLISICKNLGYHTEYVKNFDDTEDHRTMLVEFPCYSGENVIEAKDMSAVKQLELVKQMQTIWVDQASSVSVYYKKEELPEIKAWLKEHYKNSIKSVSFVLHKDHGFKQAPYEEISKEDYDILISRIKPFKGVKNIGEAILDGLECTGGACPIK